MRAQLHTLLLASLCLIGTNACQALVEGLAAGSGAGSSSNPYAQPTNASSSLAGPSPAGQAGANLPSSSATHLSGASAAAAVAGLVQVNGRTLSAAQLQLLRSTYGQEPLPGRYWYDARTGFFGQLGGPAIGMMHPGHDFGGLPSDASNGTSGVIVNDRNLTLGEVQYLQTIVGAAIMPQRYWMDAAGNVGYEGSSAPIGNLYMLAQRAASNWNGGDNFWSSRYGSGNYNADNSAGYVSVPGYGAVSYGM